MNRVIASDAPDTFYSSPFMYNKVTKAQEVEENQPPLGTKFKSYELNKAVNYYTLDPFQYSITKFDYNLPSKQNKIEFKNDQGLVYRDVNFEKLLPTFTQVKKSANDFRAQDYHRFEANNGYFNTKEATDNSDLWYYGAVNNARTNGMGIAGATLNVQEPNHIIFPEPQRGGVDTKNLTKYSWSNYTPTPSDSWESQKTILNNKNCEFFNYNSGYANGRIDQDVYKFDSNYCRNIGISAPHTGTMPFN